jgi:glyoxylase-like metal-dependent hydrolase (beta-lactamase superfamily II)
VLTQSDICRVDFGYFVRPESETGTGAPRVEPVLGYLVRLPDGLLLFDTGMGTGEPDLEEHYRPARRPLGAALADHGVAVDEVRTVVNCHLHFDHCGGNPELPGRRVLVQAGELRQARTDPAYTLQHLLDYPGAGYDELSGETEIGPGVWVLPTPGHTAGHQSLVVRCQDGTVVLAGQGFDTAAQLTGEQLAVQAGDDGVAPPLPAVACWLGRLLELDPARVLFAHDMAVWEPARPGRGPEP